MTKEEVAEIITYCEEQKVSYKTVRGRSSHTGHPRLICYVNVGKFRIDNNFVENAIRPLGRGRKNFLFCGNHDAAFYQSCTILKNYKPKHGTDL